MILSSKELKLVFFVWEFKWLAFNEINSQVFNRKYRNAEGNYILGYNLMSRADSY